MVIAVTGYHGTGSSAVIDLLSEYEGCSECGLRGYEHVPLYYPGGLFDLEYKLLWGNDPHRSDEAIKSFRKAMYELNEYGPDWFGGYQKRYGTEFKDITDSFLEKIVQSKCTGVWYNYFMPPQFSFEKLIKDCVKKVIPGKKINGEFAKTPYELTRQEIERSFLTEEEFYDSAKEFVRNYCTMINSQQTPTLLIDHLIVPQNAYKVENFFDDDFRFIILDRDVRDMFVLCKYVWRDMGFDSPYPDSAEEFLELWSRMRKTERKTDSPKVLYLHFEDLIYSYDETVARIEKFVGLTPEQHVRPRTRFIPENSINNTQNFLINDEWKREVDYFTDKTDDIYPFPFVRKPNIENTFDNQE